MTEPQSCHWKATVWQRNQRGMTLTQLVLGEEKYGPGSEPQWKAGGARYPNLYKALLEEPLRTRRIKLLEDNSRAKKGDVVL